jgi:DNA-binding NtrC family response regulator
LTLRREWIPAVSGDRASAVQDGNVSEVHTQLLTDDASGALVERRYRLRVAAGPDQGKDHALEDGTTLVGTHPDNDLVLTDATVSRHHLEIRVRRDGIEVRDLETTNGTRHGGAWIGQVILVGPARLRLGRHTELDVEPVDAGVELDDWPGDRFGDVLGTAPVMRRMFALLARAAATEATLLLTGETGTGKEAIAEAVHQASPRAKGPFVVVDCGSIPHELIASELFGHARGSFTGAAADKQGLIEAANHGTLFLDEIGELALDLQPQLLRVLDRRQVRRVGETHAIDVDIRVIAATHRDLRAMVRAGRFREDLYYRLAVVATQVPALRERKDDIPALVTWFAERMGRGAFAQSPALIEQLLRHDWPGNVRELRNVVERALSLGNAALADLGDPAAPPRPATAPGDTGAPLDDGAGRPPTSPPGASTAISGDVLDLPFKEAKAALVEGFERDYLTALLARHRGNISRAASEAGIDRNYVHRLVKKYGLEVDRG